MYFTGGDQDLPRHQDSVGGGAQQVQPEPELCQQTEACQVPAGAELVSDNDVISSSVLPSQPLTPSLLPG